MQKRRITDISITWTFSCLALAACGGGGGGGRSATSGGLGGSAVSISFQGNYILGTPNTDDFRATAGKDFIIDHSGQNNIRGEQGNDLIVASGGVIHGDENNDIISVISQMKMPSSPSLLPLVLVWGRLPSSLGLLSFGLLNLRCWLSPHL